MATFVYRYIGTTTGSFTNGKEYTSVASDGSTLLFLDDNNQVTGDGWGAINTGVNWTLISITGVTQIYP